MSKFPTKSAALGQFSVKRQQQGVVLFFALISLVILTLAGLAIMRSVDTATLIAGNIAFRQSAAQAGDYGVEDARTWLMNRSISELSQNNGGGAYNWYWANWQDTFDPHVYDWNNAAFTMNSTYAGNTVSYVIHRMCQYAGDYTDPNTYCLTAQLSATPGNSNRVSGYGGSAAVNASVAPYYRITVRVSGPRNTQVFVQSVVY